MKTDINTAPAIALERRACAGISLIEVLVSLGFLAVSLMATAQSMKMTFGATKQTIRESIALELATGKLEELLSRSPATLSSSNNSTESLLVNSIGYTRVATITVNSDGSRAITVQVTGTTGNGGDSTVSSIASLPGNV